MTESKDKPTGLALLRMPFPAHQIGKLPKPLKARDEDKGKCENSRYSADGFYCGGWHARSIHLDFVGHAALTDRLLDADPTWTWHPYALDEDGLPKRDQQGGLWLHLTVCGVTRPGYGDAAGKTGPNAVKEAIGDGLRNAGMRFGMALDLWHKGDLHSDASDDRTPGAPLADAATAGQISSPAALASVPADWLAQIAACQTIGAANALFKRIRDAGGLDAAAKAALTERSAQIRQAS